MKKRRINTWCIVILLYAFIFQACSTDEFELKEPVFHPYLSDAGFKSLDYTHDLKLRSISCELGKPFFESDIPPSECALTDFALVLFDYFNDFLNDPYFDFDLTNYYLDLHRKYVTHYRGDNYYGENGEYTQLAKKRIKELTRFWNLNRNIVLNGQHTVSLNDREILTDMIESFDRSVRNRDEAYAKADELLQINSLSPNMPESPYFAMEAFTLSNGLLVIGDGLIESLVEAGIDGDIAFTGILSHEWWHQVQYEYAGSWPELNEFTEPGERSRFIELEADFAAAYFMTHKRGATYNWKRIEEFFRLSFNVGDCLTGSDEHHGTPQQRLDAARLGFELADSAQKKGLILSPDAVHDYFVENFEKIQ